MGIDWTEEATKWIFSFGSSSVSSSVIDARKLPDDLRNLSSTLTGSRTVINKAECWHFKDENLAKLLRELKDTTYDAEDLLDKFSYCELQRKLADGKATELLLLTCSFIRDLVCRTPDHVKRLQEKLVRVAEQLNGVMASLGLADEPGKEVLLDYKVTGSFGSESGVFGREEDVEKVIGKLLVPSNTRVDDGFWAKRKREEKLNVLSIVGMGGVGKTTLAQLVYCEPRVKKFFNDRLFWVHVSEEFNVTRLTKEIVECVAPNQFHGTNFNNLQQELSKAVRTEKFLLVLDDVWNEDVTLWNRLFGPMRDCMDGSMILVTTRYRGIADMIRTVEPIFLGGLNEEVYLEFFKRCAFGFEDPNAYPNLQHIAEKISSKLKGSPLAARTLGGMLRSHKDIRCWWSVMNSELWELVQTDNDILPVLQLSYEYLPAHLKKCFSFCSIFPKGYEFDKKNLINLWVAQGIVKPQGNMQLEDVGFNYLNDLISRSFLQPYPCVKTSRYYIIHDLIHDLARFVSMDESFCLHNPKGKNMIPLTVRHISICFEIIEQENLMALCKYQKLRSLMVLNKIRGDLSNLMNTLFKKLQNLRYLSLDCCEIYKLPESVGNLQHLRYLDLSMAGIKELPKSIYSLCNLQFLFLSKDPESKLNITGDEFPQGFAKLVNLRLLYPVTILSKMPEIKKLIYLQYLPKFMVLPKSEKGNIGELKNLRQLRGSLRINMLENVTRKEEANEASLNNKEYLDKLALEWSSNRNENEKMNLDITDSGVLNCLQPPVSIKVLEIINFRGIEPPIWLNGENMPCLGSLYFHNCICLDKLPDLPHPIKKLHLEDLNAINSVSLDDCVQISRLSELIIKRCRNLKYLDDWFLPSHLPDMESLHIESCENLISLFGEKFENFTSLKELAIINCPKLVSDIKFLLPPSITQCVLDSCGELDQWIPTCLNNLDNLTTLKLRGCKNVTSLSFEEMRNLKKLQHLTIHGCNMLSGIDGVLSLSSLEYLEILNCPQLTTNDNEITIEHEENDMEIMREHGKNQKEEMLQNLEHLVIDNTSISKLHPPALLSLEICNSFDNLIPDECQKWLTNITSLEKLCFRKCGELVQLPEELHKLRLTSLHIFECPNINSLPDESLPTCLTDIRIKDCGGLGKLAIEYLTRRDSLAPHTLTGIS